MPLLVVLGTGMSCYGILMLIWLLMNQQWEREIPLRLHAKDSHQELAGRARCPEIVVRADDQVEMDGHVSDTRTSRMLPSLRTKIRRHLATTDAIKIVIYVEAEACYERMMDVLNACAACQCTQYHLVILEPLVGPRLPYVREPVIEPQLSREERQAVFFMRRLSRGY
ncbi:MAG: ExbD/TolR family protein [Prosthecobacter sp.]